MKHVLILATLLISSIYAEELPSLETFIARRGEMVNEGSVTAKQREFFTKLLSDNPWIHRIAEIGFNAGHSSETFLQTKSDVHVTSFDIMIHSYCAVAKEYIDQKYPNRHTLVRGDSKITVKKFAKKQPKLIFDLIFIDGNHNKKHAQNDIINMEKFSCPHTLLIVDDIDIPSVQRAWDYCVELGIVQQIKRFEGDGRHWLLARYKK